MRAKPAARQFDGDFGEASSNTAVIASGTALTQSCRTGVSSSLLPA